MIIFIVDDNLNRLMDTPNSWGWKGPLELGQWDAHCLPSPALRIARDGKQCQCWTTFTGGKFLFMFKGNFLC